MIASLRGEVIDKGLDYLVIECGGVGYHCSAAADTLAEIMRGEEAFVYTSFVVREDAQTLYAFSTPEQRTMFETLQKVSGVGARVSMAVMSVLSPIEVIRAVADGDTKTLQRAPGVGKRLADRMAVDLRGKLPEVPTEEPQEELPNIAEFSAGNQEIQQQVVEALEGLGFSEAKAKKATAKVAASLEESEAELDASVLLRSSLKLLSGGSR